MVEIPLLANSERQSPEAIFETKRLFLAIQLPERERQSLTRVAEIALAAGGRSDWHRHKVRWVQPENLHLTLRFLGDVSPDQFTVLRTQLMGIAPVGPMVLLTGDPLFFPPHGPIRVVAASVTEEQEAGLELLHRQIEKACEAAGFSADRLPFKPHITLARCRDGLPATLRSRWFWHDYDGLEQLPRLRFTASEFVVMESVLGGPAPQYHVRERIPISA